MQRQNDQTLMTLPTSLKAQIERAERLLDQSDSAHARGNDSLAIVRVQEAFRVLHQLAISAPDRAFSLMAAEMGFTGFEFEAVERIDRYQVIERKFLGMSMGSEVVNVPTITTRTLRGRLFP